MKRHEKFLICGLLYGDYPQLAWRLLGTLRRVADPLTVGEIRLGANAVGADTRQALANFQAVCPVPVVVCRSAANVGKYPMMWRLFNDFDTPYRDVMWFDDDSWVDDAARGTEWARVAHAQRVRKPLALHGRTYTVGLKPRQLEAIAEQPWYDGKLFDAPEHKVKFVTGGWWMAPLDLFRVWSWPPPALWHRGGDSLLGELCRQQGVEVVRWYDHVHINDSRRRGLNPPWVWEEGLPAAPARRPQFELEATYGHAGHPPGPHPG